MWRRPEIQVTSQHFLGIGLIGALVASLAVVGLSGESAVWSTELLEPGILLANAGLAVWVSEMYRAELRRAFALIASFLFSYGLVNIAPFRDWLAEVLAGSYLTVLLAWQVVTYALLVTASVYILKAVGLRRLKGPSLGVVVGAVLLAVIVVAKGVPLFLDQLDIDTTGAALLMLIRVLDMLVMLMLVPVVLVYGQNSRAEHKESATFATIVAGIIISLVFVYPYEFIAEIGRAHV